MSHQMNFKQKILDILCEENKIEKFNISDISIKDGKNELQNCIFFLGWVIIFFSFIVFAVFVIRVYFNDAYEKMDIFVYSALAEVLFIIASFSTLEKINEFIEKKSPKINNKQKKLYRKLENIINDFNVVKNEVTEDEFLNGLKKSIKNRERVQKDLVYKKYFL